MAVTREDLLRHAVRVERSDCADSSPENTYVGADQVFGTPELAEMILECLHPLDLLCATQICQSTTALLDSSRRVRKAMFLEPDEKAGTCVPFDEHEDVSFKTSCQNVYSCPYLISDATVVGKKLSARFKPDVKLPRIGKRARSILVCQSPKLEATISLDCCSPLGLSVRPEFHLTKGESEAEPILVDELDETRDRQNTAASSGITIGHLYDATEVIRQDHRLCHFVRPESLDGEGYAMIDVKFTLSRPTGMTLERLEARIPAVLSMGRSTSEHPVRRLRRMKRYTQAKRRAFHQGLLIPTLVEYEEAEGDAESEPYSPLDPAHLGWLAEGK